MLPIGCNDISLWIYCQLGQRSIVLHVPLGDVPAILDRLCSLLQLVRLEDAYPKRLFKPVQFLWPSYLRQRKAQKQN